MDINRRLDDYNSELLQRISKY